MKEIKITGTKWYMDVECDGNIARFSGELGDNGFYADANSVMWIRHSGFATDESRVELIRDVQETDSEVAVFFVDKSGELLGRTRPKIGKSRDARVKFDILNIEKEKIDIELDGRIARFKGNMWEYGFHVNKRKMKWLYPEERIGTYKESIRFTKELKRIYKKEPRENRRRFQLVFMR